MHFSILSKFRVILNPVEIPRPEFCVKAGTPLRNLNPPDVTNGTRLQTKYLNEQDNKSIFLYYYRSQNTMLIYL